MLTAALSDLRHWVTWLMAAEIPVLASTAAELNQLAAAEAAGHDVAPQMLAQACNGDPLIAIRVFIEAAKRRSAGQVTDAENLTATIILMGTARFFRTFQGIATVEQHLATHPDALAGLQRVVRRSHRAARFALGFAVHRRDPDAAAVHDAALLHDFVELLLWCHAPRLVQEIRRRQAADPTLRSLDAQRDVLGVDIDSLEHALMQAWRMPTLLAELTDECENHPLRAPQRRMVQLGVRLARHTADGWQNAALPDDVHDISQMLNLSHGATSRLLHEIDNAR